MDEGKHYRWDSPGDWLAEKIAAGDEYALRGYLNAIVGTLDSDTIQDIFQAEMQTDGYFDPDVDHYDEDEDEPDEGESNEPEPEPC